MKLAKQALTLAEGATVTGMLFLSFAVLALLVIVAASLTIKQVAAKLAVFLALGGATVALLIASGRTDVVHHVFLEEYTQFLPIPLAAVLIASLELFRVAGRTPRPEIGWFLLVICPLVGNFGTTWALVPVALSIAPALRAAYPNRWFRILVVVCIFAMNFTALATLAADPPQAFWAVKEAERGNRLHFFFPFHQYWVYLAFTMALYGMTLRKLGVQFGIVSELRNIRPESWAKTLYGAAIVACLVVSVTLLRGYQITVGLGVVCLVAALSSFWFGKRIIHNTAEWMIETACLFVAFFSVVALARCGLSETPLSPEAMVPVVIIMTAFADNVAAFATAYPVYAELPQGYMVWHNLFNAVAYGGSTPLGNGPQITLLLVIMVGDKAFGTTARQVFSTWFSEVWVFFPYLLTWTIAMAALVSSDNVLSPVVQAAIGLGAILLWWIASRARRRLKRGIDSPPV